MPPRRRGGGLPQPLLLLLLLSLSPREVVSHCEGEFDLWLREVNEEYADLKREEALRYWQASVDVSGDNQQAVASFAHVK